MTINQRRTRPESADDGRKPDTYVDGMDPTNQLRRSANEVDPVQSTMTDQGSGTTTVQRRQDLRPGIGDDPFGQTGPGRAV